MPHGYDLVYVATSDTPYWNFVPPTEIDSLNPDGTIPARSEVFFNRPPFPGAEYQPAYYGDVHVLVHPDAFQPKDELLFMIDVTKYGDTESVSGYPTWCNSERDKDRKVTEAEERLHKVGGSKQQYLIHIVSVSGAKRNESPQGTKLVTVPDKK